MERENFGFYDLLDNGIAYYYAYFYATSDTYGNAGLGWIT